MAGAATSCGEAGNTTAEPTVTSAIAAGTTTMPQTFYIPSGDELIPMPDEPSSYWVSEVLSVGLESDTADPEETIQEIANLHEAIIVGALPDLLGYELRLAGHDPDELKALGETIAERSDVGFALPSLVTEFNPDF